MTRCTLGQRPLIWLTFSALIIALSAAGCSSDEGSSDAEGSAATCSETRCTPGAVECFGNAVWTCDAAGLAWSKSGCGGLQSCVDGACVDSVCQIPLKAQCDDDVSGTLCAADKLSESTFECGADEVCEEGVCIGGGCEPEDSACGYRAVFSCVNGAWSGEKCDPGEICVTDDVGSRCEPWRCEPGKGRCEGGSALLCDAEGREEVVTACSGSQVCESGYCVAATCDEIDQGLAGVQPVDVDASSGAEDDDTTASAEPGDVGSPGPEEVAPHPELEKISTVTFKLGGIPNTFDLAAQADYQESESRMVISASDGSRKLEINLAEVEPYTVGTWSDSDDSEVSAVLCYHDGTANQTPPEGAGCSVGFSHASILYTLVIDENNGDGFRVIGTFGATLIDAMGGQVEFTEGAFDVLHK